MYEASMAGPKAWRIVRVMQGISKSVGIVIVPQHCKPRFFCHLSLEFWVYNLQHFRSFTPMTEVARPRGDHISIVMLLDLGA